MDTVSARVPGPRFDRSWCTRRRSPLNLDVQVSWPVGSNLTAAYFSGDEKAIRFYSGPYQRLDTYRAVAEGVDARFDEARRTALLPAFRGRAAEDRDRLRAFVEEGGYVVTTGQQAGLMTGPLFTLHKALTAISLAKRLEAAFGRPVLPVFWIASEDHDWEEASHTHLLSSENELLRLDAVPAEEPGDRPVHQIPLAGPDAVIDAAGEVFIPNDFKADCLALLEQAYAGKASLADGFERLLDAFLGDAGLLIVRAEDPTIKALSAGVLHASVERGEDLEERLAERSRALVASGYHEQVTLIERGLQVFEEGDAGRTRLYRTDSGVRMGKEGPERPLPDVLADIDADPGRFSPNALLRPVAEAAALPVLAYVAGPGEAAYYAQNGVLYEGLGVTMPVIYPRASARVIERKVAKVLDKYELAPEALAEPVHEIVTRLAKDDVPQEVRASLSAIRAALGSGAADLIKGVRDIDPTLKGPIGQARNQALQGFQDAEKKIVQAIKRKNETVEEQLSKARANLFPGGVPQERVLNVFHFLSRYGPDILELVADKIDTSLVEPD